MFEVMDQLYFACALVFWGKSMARTAWNTLNLSRSFKTQISAQILENCHPCSTKVCTGFQKTRQPDCKILLVCLHRVPCGWEISFSDRSSIMGRSIEALLWHKAIRIKDDFPMEMLVSIQFPIVRGRNSSCLTQKEGNYLNSYEKHTSGANWSRGNDTICADSAKFCV